MHSQLEDSCTMDNAGPATPLPFQPPPPPPRPARPVRVPGYVLEASSTADADSWIQHQTFFTQNRLLLQSIRAGQPVFLWDAEAQQLHGVFTRHSDPSALQEDLTSLPGPQGYKVHVQPYYIFPAPLALQDMQRVLLQQRSNSSEPESTSSNTAEGSSSTFDPFIGSWQHFALWEAFMKKAKRARTQAGAPGPAPASAVAAAPANTAASPMSGLE